MCYLQCTPSNIFVPRNNWNIISLNCTKNITNANYVHRLAKIIEQETGYNPFQATNFRKREFVVARQILMVLLAESGRKNSLYKIGSVVGKDHATVLHSKKAIANLYETDVEFRLTFDKIKMRVFKI